MKRRRLLSFYESTGISSSRPISDAIIGSKRLLDPEDNRIRLSNFSFLDDPEAAIQNLSMVAEAGRGNIEHYIDFVDPTCRDISPYMVLGLMRQEMKARSCRGGKIGEEVGVVLSNVGMKSFLHMRYTEDPELRHVEPFPLVYQSNVLGRAKDFVLHESKKEKTASALTEKINGWLRETGVELTDSFARQIKTLLNEMLDNSRHASSHGPGSDATWAIAGFMARRERADGSTEFACHIGFVSLGRSFAKTLLGAINETVKSDIKAYVAAHRYASRKLDANALITSMAFTDGITCTRGKGGCGLSKLVRIVNTLGGKRHPDELPGLVVVSGNSCVRMTAPYNEMVIAPDNTLFQCFNEKQSVHLPPDVTHVYKLPYSFPGTVVAVRFVLDELELRQLAGVGQSDD